MAYEMDTEQYTCTVKAKAQVKVAGGGSGWDPLHTASIRPAGNDVAAAQGICLSQGWAWSGQRIVNRERNACCLARRSLSPFAGAGGLAGEPPKFTGSLWWAASC